MYASGNASTWTSDALRDSTTSTSLEVNRAAIASSLGMTPAYST